jgi:type III secretory pathway lipoprotein EscJ
MKEREIYRGIEFVRISNLPIEQSERILDSFPKESIIKILNDDVIIKDCIPYRDYQEWFKKFYLVSSPMATKNHERKFIHSLNHSFK